MTQAIQWTKPVCQLDAENLYIGQVAADLDIMARDGSYIIPGGCIDTAPPEIPANNVARWTGDKWEFIEDHRGKVAYKKDDGEEMYILKVGALPDTLTLLPPPSPYCDWDGDKWIENPAKKAEAEQRYLNLVKTMALNDIAKAAQDIVAQKSGMDKLPAFEVGTWPLQAAEARAWQADNNAQTPLLDQIATARGIDPVELKTAALRKTLEFEALSATVAGQRQAMEKQIEMAETVDAVRAVSPRFKVV